MCKQRIENGALIKGVKKAEWDKETGMITVTYNPDKVELIDIHKAIAELGHSTDKVKAKESAYKKLPLCCQYDDGANKHQCNADHLVFICFTPIYFPSFGPGSGG